MHFGTYMGIYWILKFILFPIGITIPFLSFLFIGLTLGVPFIGYYYVRMYRDKICGGYIDFLPAWAFTVFMYMFASLLAAVGHYIYFQFIDQGFIFSSIQKSLNEVMQLLANQQQLTEQTKNVINELTTIFRSLTPFDITMQMISKNMIFGAIIALPTALFVMRKGRPVENTKPPLES